MTLIYRPGWRLRCIDPPLAWVRVTDEITPVVGVRLQLTTYLTWRWATPVKIRELQLRVTAGEREFLVPWDAVADPVGDPLGEELEYSVDGAAPHHAFVDFASDAPDLVSLFESEPGSLPVAVEARMNLAVEFREIATLDLDSGDTVLRGNTWRKAETGRRIKPQE